MRDESPLLRFTLATRKSEDLEFAFASDVLHTSPEMRRDSTVGSVLKEASLATTLHLVGHLGPELEVKTAIIDAPAAIHVQVVAIAEAVK
jgi:hypothetical protein